MAKENLKGLEDAEAEWYLVGFKDNEVVCIDGGHSEIEGTAEALKLHRGIFGASRYEGVAWRAAFLMPVPDVDVPVNDEAVAACRMMVDMYGKRGG